jgi:hypothetical protein
LEVRTYRIAAASLAAAMLSHISILQPAAADSAFAVVNPRGADSVLVRPGGTASVASADRSRIQMDALPGGAMEKGGMR